MKLCEQCGKQPATTPDRNKPGRAIKRICGQCHRNRLMDDLITILENNK